MFVVFIFYDIVHIKLMSWIPIRGCKYFYSTFLVENQDARIAII
jgi:hypothetical protein